MGVLGDFGMAVGGDVLGTALGLATQNIANKNNYKWSEKAAESSFKRQMEMYERQYKDKSPLNVVNQLEAAGLNKSLMFSGGAGGVGGAASGATAPQTQFSGQAPQKGLNLAVTMTQLEQMKAQTDLIKAQKDKTEAETGGVNTNIAKMNSEIENIKAATTNTELRNQLQNIQNEIAEATKTASIWEATNRVAKLEAEISNIMQNTELTEANKTTVNESRAYIITQMVQNIAESTSKIKLNNEQIDKIKNEIAVMQQQIDINEFNAETGRGQLIKAVGKDVADIIMTLLMKGKK